MGRFAMEVNRSPALWIYRIAWEPVLFFANALAGLKLFPRWRLNERLGRNWKPPSGQPAIWMHAASLGECKGLWSLAQSLQDLPVSFILTSNTTAGLEFLSRQIESSEKPHRWQAVLAPFDHPRIVQRFLDCFQIKALLLFEVELWPHFILTAKRNQKPVFWVSARLTPKAHHRYAKFPGAMQAVLGALTWVQAQSEEETKELQSWGCKSVDVGGDLRGLHYLNASATKKKTRAWEDLEGVAFISLHAAEIPCLLSAIELRSKDTPVFVFPRKMEEVAHFQNALEPLGFALHFHHSENRLLIVDSFGKVGEFLKRCHTAVIGGSFEPRGGHNLWEPLAAGVSMIIGPHHWNQDYLVHKLEAAGLLKLSNAPLDGEILQKPNVDPSSPCQDFIETEKALLSTAINQIRARLLLYCP